jgi:hypothetical protein
MRLPCCLCVCVPPIVASQQLVTYVPAATNTHGTAEELLDAVFSVWSVSCPTQYVVEGT